MKQITLRQDQLNLKSDIYAAWDGGANTVLAVSPTGSGKSVVFSDIALDKHRLGAKQVVIAHRKELVSQMSCHVARRGIAHRIIGPDDVISGIVKKHRKEFGKSFVNPDANCSVAGIDTLNARSNDLKKWAEQIDFVEGDEGHHFLKNNKWGKGVSLFRNARVLLMTASPTRADGMGLGSHADGLADCMVLGPTMRELINIGALTDYEIVCPESDFEIDENAVTDSGDFSLSKMKQASEKSHIVGDVVKEYVKHAYGKRAICFATDVETANKIANNFNAVGIPAMAVSANTPSLTRDYATESFENGKLWILVNVDLFGEGFDVPACEVVIMARPTASLAVFLQQFGRALRVLFGKKFGLIIDHVSNWKRHGLPDKPHFWSLDRRQKRGKQEKDPEEIPLTVCKSCFKPYMKFLTCCPYCGAVLPLPAPGGRTIEAVEGDLFLLDRDKLEQIRKSMELPSPADVGNRVAFAAGNGAGIHAVRNQIERIEMQQRLTALIDQWAGNQRFKGRSDQESYRRFYYATGVDTLTALTLPRVDMEILANRVTEWISNHE